jgi:hypothetical protein
VRSERQIALEVFERGREALEPEVEDSAIAKLARIVRRDDENPVDRQKSARKIADPEIVELQVSEHPGQGLSGRGRRQQAVVHLRLGTVARPELLRALLAGDHLAEEGIDQSFALAHPPDEEVPRKAHAHYG